jgi:hypothetical protein
MVLADCNQVHDAARFTAIWSTKCQ